MSAPSNPQAFPCEQHETLDGSWNQTFEAGMTLRDWFAGQALPRVIESADMPVWAGNEYQAAKRAYDFADAMLAARGAA